MSEIASSMATHGFVATTELLRRLYALHWPVRMQPLRTWIEEQANRIDRLPRVEYAPRMEMLNLLVAGLESE